MQALEHLKAITMKPPAEGWAAHIQFGHDCSGTVISIPNLGLEFRGEGHGINGYRFTANLNQNWTFKKRRFWGGDREAIGADGTPFFFARFDRRIERSRQEWSASLDDVHFVPYVYTPRPPEVVAELSNVVKTVKRMIKEGLMAAVSIALLRDQYPEQWLVQFGPVEFVQVFRGSREAYVYASTEVHPITAAAAGFLMCRHGYTTDGPSSSD